MNQIVQHPTHISITDYQLGECKRVENAYIYRENWIFHPVGIVYDKDSKELRIFGGADIRFIQRLTNLDYVNDYSMDPYAEISTRLRGFPRDTLQKEIIQFLVGTGKYESNLNEPQLSCNAETGEGKTFCAIAMIAFMNVKTIIIVNRDNIRTNWRNEILKFTDLDHRKLLVLNKGDIIRDILDNKLDGSQYDIFIVVHRMLDNIAKERGWEAIHQLFMKLKIGLKIYDEAHKEFLNTTYIDCYTNTKKTIYLTATPKLSSPKANYIFQNVFKRIPKFNQRALGYLDAKKHIQMLVILYDSRPSMDAIHRCFNARLKYFSAKEHSIYQIEEDPFFFIILEELVDKMVIRNGFRTLILVSRIRACDEICKAIYDRFKIKVGTYHSKMSKNEKEKVLKECKVIVSTNQSLGLGETIPELQFVLNCESHRNYGDQASGRLRRFEDGRPCIYGELVDCGFKSIVKQWRDRRKHYMTIFREVIELDKRRM